MDRQFELYRQMNIIPGNIVSLRHPANLILLCGVCHPAFDHSPPYWIMLPTTQTIQRFINHECQDYSARARAGRRGIFQPRSLPQVDCNSIRYQVYILNRRFAENGLLETISAPRPWLGHPVPAIIKGSEGVITPSQRVTVRSGLGQNIDIGVPNLVRNKIVQLMNIWDRPDPVIRREQAGPAGPPMGPGGQSGSGGPDGAGAGGAGVGGDRSGGDGRGHKRKTRGWGANIPPTDRQLRPRKAVLEGEPEAQDTHEKVVGWLSNIGTRGYWA